MSTVPFAKAFAPYAPPANVIEVLKRLRARGLPEVLTNQEMVRIGIAEGNASRVTQALKYLNLIDDEGKQTANLQRLGRASSEEYSEVLSEILTTAYADVFEIVDVDNCTESQIDDAFRHCQPEGQRTRMVTLFTGLCREADMMSADKPAARQSTKPTRRKVTRKLPSPKTLESNGSSALPERAQQSSLFDESKHDQYELLHGLIHKLPDNANWTPPEYDRWLTAFTGMLNLLVNKSSPLEMNQKGSMAEHSATLPLSDIGSTT